MFWNSRPPTNTFWLTAMSATTSTTLGAWIRRWIGFLRRGRHIWHSFFWKAYMKILSLIKKGLWSPLFFSKYGWICSKCNESSDSERSEQVDPSPVDDDNSNDGVTRRLRQRCDHTKARKMAEQEVDFIYFEKIFISIILVSFPELFLFIKNDLYSGAA